MCIITDIFREAYCPITNIHCNTFVCIYCTIYHFKLTVLLVRTINAIMYPIGITDFFMWHTPEAIFASKYIPCAIFRKRNIITKPLPNWILIYEETYETYSETFCRIPICTITSLVRLDGRGRSYSDVTSGLVMFSEHFGLQKGHS